MSSRPSRGAARLAAILDALPDGLVLVNANGTVVNANSIALDLFEAPGTALVGRGLLDLVPDFDSRLIPGSMRRPDPADTRGRTKPARMIARRTDGSEFPVEVTSASLDGREAYDSAGGYTGDELLMLVVRDLTGTMDTEAELARSQRQTEMILRAAAEGVVGTDTDGRVVLVNPAAAQILGFRASDLGGQELHPLILHSRADGDPFPYEESPLADTLKSGRKHRVRGQVLWSKSGARVPVDLTTAPVRDGDQLVGAVMTFTDRRPFDEATEKHAAELAATEERLGGELAETTERLTAELTAAAEKHEAELADRAERYAAELEAGAERYEELTARHAQLTAVLGDSLRGPLEELRAELGALAADPAGQLWPEANQILHHLAAGYARMTTLVDNVLGYQRLDTGTERLAKANVLLDGIVAAGVEGAVELIGPGRVQFAVHAPPIEAEVDGARLATALAHLVADVAGVDSTGKARVVPGGGYVDSTIVVAAAQRGDVVRIEVRGPFAGGDPVHAPIVHGIVRAHGGVLQTHEVPGTGGSAYVLEVPSARAPGRCRRLPRPRRTPRPARPADGRHGVLRRRAPPGAPRVDRRLPGKPGGGGGPGGGTAADRAAPRGPSGRGAGPRGDTDGRSVRPEGGTDGGTGRRRGRPSPAEQPAAPQAAEGSVVTAAEGAGGRAAFGETVPPQGVPVDAHGVAGPPSGRRARREVEPPRSGLPELAAASPKGPRSPPDAEPAGRSRPRRGPSRRPPPAARSRSRPPKPTGCPLPRRPPTPSATTRWPRPLATSSTRLRSSTPPPPAGAGRPPPPTAHPPRAFPSRAPPRTAPRPSPPRRTARPPEPPRPTARPHRASRRPGRRPRRASRPGPRPPRARPRAGPRTPRRRRSPAPVRCGCPRRGWPSRCPPRSPRPTRRRGAPSASAPSARASPSPSTSPSSRTSRSAPAAAASWAPARTASCRRPPPGRTPAAGRPGARSGAARRARPGRLAAAGRPLRGTRLRHRGARRRRRGPAAAGRPRGAVEVANRPLPQPVDDELPPSRSTTLAGSWCGPRRTSPPSRR
ncbi:PAS domain-containing protein [Streptomyces zhihengii]